MMGAHHLLAPSQSTRTLLVTILLVLVTMVMVEGQGEGEEGREGRKLVLKKVRRKQPQPIGQCPQVSCSPRLR